MDNKFNEGDEIATLTLQQQEVLEAMVIKINDWVSQNHMEECHKNLSNGYPKMLALKFLRARQFNITTSLPLLTNCLVWRNEFQEIGVDNILAYENTIEKELTIGKTFIHKWDKQERPVCYIFARLHSKSNSVHEEVCRLTIFMFEKLRKSLQSPLGRATVLIDLRGFGYDNMDYSFCKFLFDCLSTKYPEGLGLCLLAEAPFLFSACWKIISPWIDPVTAAKVKFVSLAQIQEFVDKENIIMSMGGSDPFEYKYVPLEENQQHNLSNTN